MKKIMTAIALAAVIASSVFAAGVGAKVKIDGSLFNWDVKGKSIKMLSIKHGGESWNPLLSLGASSDLAGATFNFYDNGRTLANKKPTNDYSHFSYGYTIWFKPFDTIKVTLGGFSGVLNQSPIDYDETNSKTDGTGVAVSFADKSFSADIFYYPGWDAPYYHSTRTTEESYQGLYTRAGLNSQIGNFSASVDWKIQEEEVFGVGYQKGIGPVSMFTNFLIRTQDQDLKNIRSEWYMATGIGPVGISAFAVVGWNAEGEQFSYRIGNASSHKSGAVLACLIKVSSQIGPLGVYVKLKDNDLLSKSFAMHIEPGVSGSVGLASWSASLNVDFEVKKSFTIDVPVSFTVNF